MRWCPVETCARTATASASSSAVASSPDWSSPPARSRTAGDSSGRRCSRADDPRLRNRDPSRVSHSRERTACSETLMRSFQNRMPRWADARHCGPWSRNGPEFRAAPAFRDGGQEPVLKLQRADATLTANLWHGSRAAGNPRARGASWPFLIPGPARVIASESRDG